MIEGEGTIVQVLMVAPTAFVFNEQTAADNTFMHASGKTGSTSNVAVSVCCALREEDCCAHLAQPS